MHVDLAQYLTKSSRVDTSGIDYARAAEVGISDDEAFVLTYFADVENQSLRYLRMLLSMRLAYRTDVAAFLATWNYEEFFHGFELERLLRAVGRPLDAQRRAHKVASARLNEKLEALVVPVLSRVFEADFPAVYFVFGALQELTTLRGYESLARTTRNDALRTLCERIARQERRHFAWYYNQAEALLRTSRRAQTLTRAALKLNWVPVGAGVHEPHEVHRLFRLVFHPRHAARQSMRQIDAKLAILPGLKGMHLLERYFERAGLL